MSFESFCHGPDGATNTGSDPSTDAGDSPTFVHRVEWIARQHADRRALEAYIADAFLETYGAEVRHFCDTLIGCRDGDGNWAAALGFSFAANGRIFLEQYFDGPIERQIAAHIGLDVRREQVVEVGNLAARHVGAARTLIACMTRYLYQQEMTWVTFTATRALLNSFTRLRLKPTVLADADPARLSDGGKSWGTYYATKPQVMFGDIRSGYAQLAK